MIRSRSLPILVVVLALVAFGAIVTLQSEANAGRDAELKLANLKTALTNLQSAPFQVTPRPGSAARVLAVVTKERREVGEALRDLRQGGSTATLDLIPGPLRVNYAALDRIYALSASGAGIIGRGERPARTAIRSDRRLNRTLEAARREYESRADAADLKATVGSAGTIAILVFAFLFMYRRMTRARAGAERLAKENGALASTDALTKLGNRRALMDSLAEELSGGEGKPELVVALFDLDGFKQYNDTFGHPAGDSLLARLGGRLLLAVAGCGTAYRMGGDEFCILARPPSGEVDPFVTQAAAALTESGEGFQIDCSFGLALLPREASSAEDALQLADRRLYADKGGRSSAGRQSADVLLEVINERSLDLRDHIKEVAIQAAATARSLGLPEHQVAQIGIAAELHDIGKAAIPDTILDKRGPLDAGELQFIRTHTVIGERIMLAAPSLAPLAGIVRSSHEHFDGSGYPDGLRGAQIPSGAAIVAVCDAFDAMVAGRPYRDAIPVEDAEEELLRCAGSDFDPKVVAAFIGVLAETRARSVGVGRGDPGITAGRRSGC